MNMSFIILIISLTHLTNVIGFLGVDPEIISELNKKVRRVGSKVQQRQKTIILENKIKRESFTRGSPSNFPSQTLSFINELFDTG